MFDAPVESAYVWLGLAIVSAALVALAVEIPTVPPPDAATAARTVDRVAASPYGSMAHHPLDATRVRIGAERIGLASPGGEAHAAFAYDSVVPATGDGRLDAVLHGTPPERVFESRRAFRTAIERARTVDPEWQPAPARLLVRRVVWEDVHGTLVGA